MVTARSAPSALDEPRSRLGPLTVTLFGMANLGMWIMTLTPVQILLPKQIAAIDPAHKVIALGWVTAVGAVGAIVACPLAGALSDRTASRFGRRNPWVLGGALVMALGAVALSRQHTVYGVAVCWLVVQVSMNAMYAALTSVLPDRVPRRQRAFVAAVAALQMTLGLVVGTLLMTVVVRAVSTGYLLLAGLLLVLALPFAFTADTPLAKAERPQWSTRAFLRGFWISPRRHPDFAWAGAGRFAIQLCVSMATMYLLYYLGDVVHLPDPSSGVLVLILIYTAGILVTSLLGGRLSDRTGRRRVFVFVSSIVLIGAMLSMAFGASMRQAIVAAVLLGIGMGAFLAVDGALITEVLPAARSRAKDLGVINVANSGSQALAPVVGGGIVTLTAGYPALYAVAAALALAGAALILPIRAVR